MEGLPRTTASKDILDLILNATVSTDKPVENDSNSISPESNSEVEVVRNVNINKKEKNNRRRIRTKKSNQDGSLSKENFNGMEITSNTNDTQNTDCNIDDIGAQLTDVQLECSTRRERKLKKKMEMNQSVESTSAKQPENVTPKSVLNKSVSKKSKASPQKSNTPRKNEEENFKSYISEEEVEMGIENNLMVCGNIRINTKDYKVAYISHEDSSKPDILIRSVSDRNRALEGDLVVVYLNGNPDDPDNKNTGSVVYIKKKMHSRKAVGTLRLTEDKNRQFALFLPRDHRVPRMKIPFTDWPPMFYEESAKFENILFLAQITEWNECKFAIGTILENVGVSNDIRIETKAILVEMGLDVSPIPNEMKQYYSTTEEISTDEYKNRLDLRKECIFTIDPLTAKDLDDAMSCKQLPNGNFEIGVHIADVTYFLKDDNPLDELVSLRATSVYMVESVYHMLPKDLCMHCSLLPGMDKLTFSVIFEMTPEAEVISHKFARTVINSCAQLAYEHAQMMLEDPERKFKADELPQVHNGYTPEDLSKGVCNLHNLALKLRKGRYDGGALRIDQPKVVFSLDSATYLPISYKIYENNESHRLIEEFMLLANATVATRLMEDFPDLAFLRKHDPPKMHMLQKYQELFEKIGIHLDISSAGSLFQSLEKYTGDDRVSQARMLVLNMMCAKTMTRADYFCAASEYSPGSCNHYALNLPLYTHFTSPIRRYADMMVHRLLASSLGYQPKPNWNIGKVKNIAMQCNIKKYDAKRAGERSIELYLIHYINAKQPLIMEAVVVAIKEYSLDVIIIENGMNARVYLNKKELGIKYKIISDEDESISELSNLILQWPSKPSLPAVQEIIAIFHIVKVSLSVQEKTAKLVADLVRPEGPATPNFNCYQGTLLF